MKTKQSKVTRRITMALSLVMLAEQLAGTGAVLYAHAEDEVKTEYSIEQNVSASWEGGCNATITLTNLADKDTQDWSVTFCTYDKITSLWGGTITECVEFDNYVVEEDDVEDEIIEEWFIEDLPVEEELEETETEIPADVEMEAETEIPADAVVEAEKESNAEEAENGSEDDADVELEDAESSEMEAEVSEIVTEDAEEENVTVESEEYNYDAPATEEHEVYYQYTVKALDYNGVIASGAGITIGYCAEGNDHGIWDEKAQLTFKESNASIPVGGTYEYDGYTVEVKIPSYWDNSYNVRLLITNTSNETIHNWAFVMETADTISGLYNAVEVSGNDNKEDNIHLIKNAGYNQDIPAGKTVEVGYTASFEDDVDVPDDFALSQIETEVTTAECEVSLLISDEWENGGLAQIIIKNISELPIEDWMIEFDSALDIKEIWGGVIESHEGEHYFIRNSGYAQNILPGESWTVGILFNGEAAEIDNVQVKQIVAGNMNNAADGILSVCTDYMTINEEGNYEFAEGFEKFTGTLARVNEVTKFAMQVYDKNDIKIYETDIVPAAEWTLEDFAYIYGLDRFVFEVYFGTERYAVELVVDCKGNHNFDKLDLDLADNDGDGLYNYFEKYFGTDENDVDTDDDELTDYQELFTLGYNPLDPDTDADGTLDKDEDEDEDGLRNKEEYDLGSNPISIDSDKDNLLDSIEISYGTSLILEDTDYDGISDYEEYMLDQIGAVYNSADNTYTATFSADTMGIVYDNALIPSVTLTGDAEAITSFSISMITGSYYLNPSMVGYVGQAYDFTTDGNMVSAELTFTYDESYIDEELIKSGEFHPAIYCFNPDDDSFTEVENQTWIGNKVTVHLEHFSIYTMINMVAMEVFKNHGIEITGVDQFGIPQSDNSYTTESSEGKGKVILNVIDEYGDPVPNADVWICSSRSFGRYGIWVMLYDGIDPNKFFMKARTDASGKLECYLDGCHDSWEGCYTIFVDKDNVFGATASIGAYYGEKFHDNLMPGTERELDIVLFQYSARDAYAGNATAEFCIFDEEAGYLNTILYEYDIRLYKGWGLTDFSNPVVEERKAPKAWFNETISLSIPRGRYTIEIEKDGYPKKHLEILVSDDSVRTFLVTLGVEENIINTVVEKPNYDKNFDGLDDKYTEDICKGLITTSTGTFLFHTSLDEGDDWKETYNTIMRNSDLDGDGLKNGDEVEIYYRDGRPFLRIKSDPELKDTDFDLISDYDEMKSNKTDPMHWDYVVNIDDYSFISNRTNFEAGKAHDAYLDRTDAEIVGEFFFNVIICGGEIDINKITKLELLDLFSSYAYDNADDISVSGLCNTASTFYRGFIDIMPLIFKGDKALPIKLEINMKWDEIGRLYKQANSKAIKIALKKEISSLSNELETFCYKVDTRADIMGKVGIGISALVALAQSWEEVSEYSAGLVVIKNYMNTLEELKSSGAPNIEEAAIDISGELNSLFSYVMYDAQIFAGNIAWYGAVMAGAGFQIAKLSPYGLALEITSLAASIIVGGGMDANIKNFVTVECANGMAMAVRNTFSDASYLKDTNGNMNIVVSGDEQMAITNEVLKLSIYARKWAENKYLNYLEDERLFFEANDYLSNDANSIQRSQDNIAKLNELYYKYLY